MISGLQRTTVWLVIGSLSLSLGCASIPGATRLSVRVSKSKPFVITHSDEPLGWGRFTHPNLFPISDDLILLRYSARGDIGSPTTYTCIVTRDGGRTWDLEPEFKAIDEEGHAHVMDQDEMGFHLCGLIHRPDGVVLIHSILTHLRGALKTKDGGQTWKGPFRVSHDLKYEFGKPALMTRGIALSNEELLRPFYSRGGPGDRFSSNLIKSFDGGDTWEYWATIADTSHAPWGKEGPNETALLRHADGELLAIMRTGGHGTKLGRSDPMLLARSTDGGRTWEHQRMRIPGVMPTLVEMSNGILVLAFGRPGNNLIFSTDGGRTWGGETRITRPDQRTCGYLDIVEVEPGRLLVVYSIINSPLKRFWLWEPQYVNGLMGMYVDVDYRFGGN